MSKYTPTTEDVRDFLRQQAAVGFIADERVEQFDRWLAAHDAEVYQRGREDAADAVEATLFRDDGCSYPTNGDLIAAARGDGAGHA